MTVTARTVLLAGVDLGGTKIQAVVMTRAGVVRGEARRSTPVDGGPAHVADAIVATLRDAAASADVDLAGLRGVGVGSPGAVDAAAGTVSHARNLPDWEGTYALARHISEATGVPVKLDNDVQVAVDAEVALGAGKDRGSVLGVFWGTGVGGGIVLAGKPWVGRGAAGEIGHVVVRIDGRRCPCGRRGCLEAYAGRGSLEARARKAHAKGEKTVLFELMERAGRSRLTSGVWAKALHHEDALATRLLDDAIAALGAGVASAVNLLDVETVVIGGGLGTRLGEPAVQRIRQAMLPHLFVSDRPPDVVLAALGDLGGAIGAGLLVR